MLPNEARAQEATRASYTGLGRRRLSHEYGHIGTYVPLSRPEQPQQDAFKHRYVEPMLCTQTCALPNMTRCLSTLLLPTEQLSDLNLFDKYPSYESRAKYVIQGGRHRYDQDMLPEVPDFDINEVKHITYSCKKYSITEEWVTVRFPALTYKSCNAARLTLLCSHAAQNRNIEDKAAKKPADKQYKPFAQRRV